MGVVEQVAEHHVRRPLALLRPYADSYTGYRYAGFEPGVHMGLPSRHVTFIISFDDRLELTVLPDGRHRPTTFDAMVGGLHTTPAVVRHDGSQHGIQLHLTPAGTRGLFGLPAGALASTVVPLDALWGRLAGELLERLDAAATWTERFAVLEQVMLRALSARVEIPSGARPEATEAFRRLAAVDGRLGVAELAADLGWSRRHLTEQFSVEYGVGPKELARVLRFERSKRLLTTPERGTLATIAAECGYADQAHMARDWRSIAGSSPTRWMAEERLPIVQADADGDGA
jgi:AraC-like DNA-binding protein